MGLHKKLYLIKNSKGEYVYHDFETNSNIICAESLAKQNGWLPSAFREENVDQILLKLAEISSDNEISVEWVKEEVELVQ